MWVFKEWLRRLDDDRAPASVKLRNYKKGGGRKKRREGKKGGTKGWMRDKTKGRDAWWMLCTIACIDVGRVAGRIAIANTP